jgi:hypothetical protein
MKFSSSVAVKLLASSTVQMCVCARACVRACARGKNVLLYASGLCVLDEGVSISGVMAKLFL